MSTLLYTTLEALPLLLTLLLTAGRPLASYSTVQRDTSPSGVNIEEFDQRVSILEANPTEYTDKRNTFERDLHHRLLRRLFKQG
jgi:hypothetical protein